jgi:putative sterol carrier protein
MAAARPKPLAPPGDLTIPDPGSSTARDVLSRAIGLLLTELHALARAPEAQPLRAILRAPAGAIASLLRQPTLGVLLRCLRDRAARPAILTELEAHLGFELALRGALPDPVRIERPPSILLSPSTRRAIAITGAEAITFGSGRATVHRFVNNGGSARQAELRPQTPVTAPAGPRIATVNEYFDTLDRRFVADASRGVDAVFQWEILGSDGGTYHVTVRGGAMTLERGGHAKPTVTITMKDTDYVSMVNGDIDGKLAFMTGKGKVSGSIPMAMKMQSIFPASKRA